MHRAWQTLVDDNITAGNGRTFTSADKPGNNAWNSRFGPRFGVRWWRFGAGIMLGCALAIKWSGLYYIAFFGLFCVLGDLIIRRRYGVTRPYSAVWLRDIPAALASLVAVPVLLYLWSWRAWFASETAVYRHAAVDGTIEDGSWLHSLPDTVASWLYYHQSVLEFHSTLTSSGGHTHPWDSKPWAWLAGLRPILYYSNTELDCPLGGSEAGCRQMLFLFGTPAIWWLIVPGLLWAVWALVVRGERAFAWPLVGFAAGFIPWLAAYDRQMYFFYAAAFIPFVIVIYAIIHCLLGDGRRHVHLLLADSLRLNDYRRLVSLADVVAQLDVTVLHIAVTHPQPRRRQRTADQHDDEQNLLPAGNTKNNIADSEAGQEHAHGSDHRHHARCPIRAPRGSEQAE